MLIHIRILGRKDVISLALNVKAQDFIDLKIFVNFQRRLLLFELALSFDGSGLSNLICLTQSCSRQRLEILSSIDNFQV